MANTWWGGPTGSRPTDEDYARAGFTWRTDRENWEPPAGWGFDYENSQWVPPPSFKPLKQPTLNVGWGSSLEQLQELSKQAPVTRQRVVEGGEGSRIEYDYYDPASQAKAILAQPEKVTPEYIKQNFSGFERLPAATLQAMANDWRNAYSQLMKISSPENVPQGYTKAVSRVEGGKPFISFGGPSEMFAEAAPYVTYSPEYGLVAPQTGIRPAEKSRSALDVIGTLAPGLALSTILGPAGMGLSLPAAGAVTGGISALLNDQNVLKGALTGGALGGVGQIVSPAVASGLEAAGVTGPAADVIKGAAVGAGKAAITGGDVMQGALGGAAASGVGGALGASGTLSELDPALSKAITSAAAGAAAAAATGGDPVQAALSSAINSAAKQVGSAITAPTKTAEVTPATQYASATPQGTMFDVPVEDVPDVDMLINQMLAEQEPIVPMDKATPTESWIDAGGLATQPYSGLLDVLGAPISKEQYKTYTGPMFDAAGNLVVESGAGLAPVIPETPVAGYGEKQAPDFQDILAKLEQQQTQQQAMQQALAGYAKPEDVQQGILGALTQQKTDADAAIRALEQSTGQKIAAGDADILARLAQQGASQSQMEQALRGEIGGLGTTFDKRLQDILAQQEEQQAGMQTALQGYDQRILDLMAQGESEQAAMQKALEESQASTQQQIAGVQSGLGQQIGGLGKTILDLAKQFGGTTQNLQQQIQQSQQQAGFGNLLGLLGMMQQKQAAPPPVQLVGEIKPFQFSTDLLAGIYGPNKIGAAGTNDELLKLARG